jgi:hypothetical protein
MPPRKKTPEPVETELSLEALLEPDVESEKTAPAEDSVEESNPEDEAKAIAEERIRQLESELSKPITNPTVGGRPAPETALTPEQKRIRELEDQLAKKRAAELDKVDDQFEETDGESIHIHVVTDGFTVSGRVWYQGQEIKYSLNGAAYESTKDRFGRSWLDLDDEAQLDRWGKVYFRKGPWPGKGWTNDKAAAEERKRNGAAPVSVL